MLYFVFRISCWYLYISWQLISCLRQSSLGLGLVLGWSALSSDRVYGQSLALALTSIVQPCPRPCPRPWHNVLDTALCVCVGGGGGGGAWGQLRTNFKLNFTPDEIREMIFCNYYKTYFYVPQSVHNFLLLFKFVLPNLSYPKIFCSKSKLIIFLHNSVFFPYMCNIKRTFHQIWCSWR